MRVEDVMYRNVGLVEPNTSLQQAVQLMNEQRVPILMVCEKHRLVGLMTPRDVTVRATSRGCDPETSTVREVMTREIVCVREDQNVDEALAALRGCRFSRVPVVNQQRFPVGIVSLRDLCENPRRRSSGRI